VKEQFINHGKTDYKIYIYAVGHVGSLANMMVLRDGHLTWISNGMNKDCEMLFDIRISDENIEKSNVLSLRTNDGGKI
jgi:hypothetical protein